MMKRKNAGIKSTAVLMALLCGMGLFGCSKGTKNGTDKEEGEASLKLEALADTAFKGYEFTQMQAENIPVRYTSLNMATQYMKEKGISGDGCQWPVSFDCSKDGSLMLYGIDVAGAYRSVDHGKSFEKCDTGMTNRGVGMFGIDPKNSDHVLAVGLSGGSAANTGMHVSYDGCLSWKVTSFRIKIAGERYLWDGLEFDPTSYNEGDNMCKVAYYSIPYQRDREKRKNAYESSTLTSPLRAEQAGLYKTTDGGESFLQISQDVRLADGIVKVTENGNVFIGNQHGLFRVDGEGNILNSYLLNSFLDYETDKITVTLTGGKTADILRCYLGITGLDCVGNTIYAQTWDGIYTLDFASVKEDEACAVVPNLIVSDNYKTQNWGQFLRVSPSNPLHMVYQYRGRVDKVSWDTYWTNYVDVSFDGGRTWTTATADGATVFSEGSWLGREKLLIVDPSDDNNVLSFGSDTVMRSEDGGLSFVQTSGISNMMCGGKMHWNYYDNDIIFVAAQDYGGAVSLDKGKTFKRVKITGDGVNFGHCYDGFAADACTYYGFARPSWTGENHLVVTFDGGKSWEETGIVTPYGTPTTTVQSYKNPDVLFAGAYRSQDRGLHWAKMQGCINVSTVSYGKERELFGYDEERNVVVSIDDGKTWRTVFDRVQYKFNDSPRTVSESIRDLSYDHVNRILYAAVDSHHRNAAGEEYNSHAFYKLTLDESLSVTERKALKVYDNPDGYENFSDIEVDPNATNVVYVALAGNYFSNRYALQRSIDGGESWQVLTSNTDTEEGKKGLSLNGGGYEASMLAVDPLTGKLFIGCGCYGFEWVTPPYDGSLLTHTAPAEHEVVFVCGGRAVHREFVKNNRTFSYFYDTEGYTFAGWYTDGALTEKWKEGSCVYRSMYLYAKMEKAEEVCFYVDGAVAARTDIEDYTKIVPPQPEKAGYTFAGWFTTPELTERASFENLTRSVNVYAGFYKTGEDVFDADEYDYGAYIQYSTHKLSSVERVPFDGAAENRCAYIALHENTDYLLVFRMDARCRYGLNKREFIANKAPDAYFIDERDTNSSAPVDEWVYLPFESGDNTQMLLFYYTAASTSGRSYEEIRATICCYRLESKELLYRLNG